MQAGSSVRLKADPGRVGVVTGKTREIPGKIYWQIRFPDGFEFYQEIHLETLSEGKDPLELFSQGKFGRAKDLRGNITHIRLTGRLANLIYSMNTTNTDFYAYQFKPVINFLESPGNGLLIADEVGLGKTIEAGLIWTELRSRYDIKRVMVLCPAMLQPKWRAELKRRFGISAEIQNSDQLLQCFNEIQSGERNELYAICSMQGLRPRRGWDEEDVDQYKSSVLARFLESNRYQEPLLDLLIIDEAHYLRNPESMTADLGRLLRNVSDQILLLSATPVHLRSQDLYQLLNLVDEDTFNQPQVFDEILNANAPILRARDGVLKRSLSQQQFLGLLNDALRHPFLSENRQIRSIINDPPSEDQLQDKSFVTEIANRLENVNLLGRVVNRTRKRYVQEFRVIREPVAEIISMSETEREFYNAVTDAVREYASKNRGFESFLLVMPQRQVSSSMPAALEEWFRKGSINEEEFYEDLGIDDVNHEIGPLTRELIERVKEFGNLQALRANDSKYRRLAEMLTKHLNKHPNDKIVLFAYFKATLRYLFRRLTEDGISCVVIMGGGGNDKQEILRGFESPDGPQVLLSSEIASEGVDLQFSHILINYDLPWNPMKVEQRIGRVDRLGQKSSKITIWNLLYEDTIDYRIYTRLYNRLGIFERALGGLEAILGQEIRKMTSDLLGRKLTPEQEIARIEQTEQAISNLRAQEETLEGEANNLVAHGDYILQQVQAARELQRTISSHDIWTYIYDFFTKKYPGSQFYQLNPDDLIFDVSLSDEAKGDFEAFLKSKQLQGQTRLGSAYPKTIRCQFKNQVGQQIRGREEIISQFHPLIRFVSDSVKKSSFGYYSPVAVGLPKQEIPEVDCGIYAFSVERWSIQGVRDIEQLHVEVCRTQPEPGFLSSETAEKLITVAARNGEDWLSAANRTDLNMAINKVGICLSRSEEKYHNYIEKIQHENNDRADIQEKSLIAHQERQFEKLNHIMEKQKAQGNENIVRMTQGRINALQARVQQKMLGIKSQREIKHHKQEICIGLINIM
jgi:ERCC4-related helicase